ncbi:MAG: hypothetical protein JRI25_01405 [Deltaproteobacteria bacterium]|nr:hypothetical protein [Deltaproteobacteria bacterium]MBW2253236.1 hypothetical protein [Deltaproteobacteria bacterium]
MAKKAGPISYLGCGCGCLSLLVALLGALAILGIPLGVYNYSVEASAGIGGGGVLCVGLMGLPIGLALFLLGRRTVEDSD